MAQKSFIKPVVVILATSCEGTDDVFLEVVLKAGGLSFSQNLGTDPVNDVTEQQFLDSFGKSLNIATHLSKYIPATLVVDDSVADLAEEVAEGLHHKLHGVYKI